METKVKLGPASKAAEAGEVSGDRVREGIARPNNQERVRMDKSALAGKISEVVANVEKVIFGKHHEVELALVALACRGHILVEDVPGTGKTVLAKAIARSLP